MKVSGLRIAVSGLRNRKWQTANLKLDLGRAAGLFLALAATGAFAGGARFSRTCSVLTEPEPAGTAACVKRGGTAVLWSGAPSRGFVQVETEDCAGFVPSACIGLGGEESRRILASDDDGGRRAGLRLGVLGGVDGTLGNVGSGSSVSRGSGWAGGLEAQVSLGGSWMLSLTGVYRSVGLSRKIDLSGQLIDPNPAEFSQTYRGLGLGVGVGYVVQRLLVSGRPLREPEVTILLGAEYLYPLSGSQNSPMGTVALKPGDKLLMGTLGATLDLSFDAHMSLVAGAQVFYNLTSQGGSRLYGGRLTLALLFGLI